MNTLRFGALKVSGFDKIKPEFKNDKYPAIQSAAAMIENARESGHVAIKYGDGDSVYFALQAKMSFMEDGIAQELRDKGLTAEIIDDKDPELACAAKVRPTEDILEQAEQRQAREDGRL